MNSQSHTCSTYAFSYAFGHVCTKVGISVLPSSKFRYMFTLQQTIRAILTLTSLSYISSYFEPQHGDQQRKKPCFPSLHFSVSIHSKFLCRVVMIQSAAFLSSHEEHLTHSVWKEGKNLFESNTILVILSKIFRKGDMQRAMFAGKQVEYADMVRVKLALRTTLLFEAETLELEGWERVFQVWGLSQQKRILH